MVTPSKTPHQQPSKPDLRPTRRDITNRTGRLYTYEKSLEYVLRNKINRCCAFIQTWNLVGVGIMCVSSDSTCLRCIVLGTPRAFLTSGFGIICCVGTCDVVALLRFAVLIHIRLYLLMMVVCVCKALCAVKESVFMCVGLGKTEQTARRAGLLSRRCVGRDSAIRE